MEKSQKKRICIVEDEPDIATYLSTVFEDSGYRVETATDGVEAMKIIKAHKPDLISLDISLPEKTGVKIYCELKKDPALSTIPVVIITGIQKEIKNIFSSGDALPPPDGYISKPFSVEELKKTINGILKEI
jgi:CheY-like chemotaxis protein